MATIGTRPFFNLSFFDYSGVRPFPAAGYLLYQYVSGTTTNQTTYSDDDLTVPNTNPITLDAAGKCTIFTSPTLAYTFVLKTPGGVQVDAWNDVVSGQLPISGSFLPIAGGTMTGAIVLPGDPTTNLQAATKQYVDAGDVTTLASATTLTTAATAAAAAATAAAAAIKQGAYAVASASGGAATLDIVNPTVGTYLLVLFTAARHPTPSATGWSQTVAQNGSWNGTTVSTSLPMQKTASDTQSTYGSGLAVGTTTISAAGTFTLSLAAATLGALTGTGSLLMAIKQG